MNLHPKAKTTDIVQQNVGDELLLYNLKTNQTYYLNQTATNVYQLCDGINNIPTIAAKAKIPPETVEFSLHQLSKQNLLAEPIKFNLSRRDLLKNAALKAVALPIITSLIAPAAVRAASTCSGAVPSRGTFTITNNGGGTSSCFTTANDAMCASCRVNAASCTDVNCTTINCTCA